MSDRAFRFWLIVILALWAAAGVLTTVNNLIDFVRWVRS